MEKIFYTFVIFFIISPSCIMLSQSTYRTCLKLESSLSKALCRQYSTTCKLQQALSQALTNYKQCEDTPQYNCGLVRHAILALPCDKFCESTKPIGPCYAYICAQERERCPSGWVSYSEED